MTTEGSSTEKQHLLADKPDEEAHDDKESNSSGGSNVRLYIFSAIILMGELCVGMQLGMTSPMLPAMMCDNSSSTSIMFMTPTQQSWFSSILLVGGFVGGIVAGFVMQRIGRKWTNIVAGLPYVMGLLMIFYGYNVAMLLAARFIIGLGIGFSSLISPTYIGEIATPQLRGRLGTGAQISIVTGILVIYSIGTRFPCEWRTLALIAMIFPVISSLLTIAVPESPYYLVMKGKTKEATASLQSLRGTKDVSKEVEYMIKHMEEGEQSADWLDIIKQSRYRWPVFLSLLAMYFQQFSGINCLMFYAKPIFKSAGFTSTQQINLATILIAVFQVAFTVVSALIIEKTGRKPLMVVGGILMAISLFVFGLCLKLGGTANIGNYTVPLIVAGVSFISGYSIGIGPIAWLYVGEIIPVRARERGGALSTSFNLFLVFILTLEFHNMTVAMTPAGTFWFFTANCVLGVIVIPLLFPETKGKTLEEITSLFE